MKQIPPPEDSKSNFRLWLEDKSIEIIGVLLAIVGLLAAQQTTGAITNTWNYFLVFFNGDDATSTPDDSLPPEGPGAATDQDTVTSRGTTTDPTATTARTTPTGPTTATTRTTTTAPTIDAVELKPVDFGVECSHSSMSSSPLEGASPISFSYAKAEKVDSREGLTFWRVTVDISSSGVANEGSYGIEAQYLDPISNEWLPTGKLSTRDSSCEVNPNGTLHNLTMEALTNAPGSLGIAAESADATVPKLRLRAVSNDQNEGTHDWVGI